MPTDSKPLASGLYLVATPIGNLRDVTLRALDVIAGVDVVLAEDTRVTGKLLSAYGISAKLERYDDHAAYRIRPRILKALADGARVALVSDAGTPLVSDPGYRLVAEAAAQGASVIPIPGASAVMAALTASGLPTDRFLFAGFPPVRPIARQRFFGELAHIRATLIFFEGGPRLARCLSDMALVLGVRQAAVARELTKLHETIIRAKLADLAHDPRLSAPKGEIVIIVGAGHAPAASAEDVDLALTEALTRLAPAEAASSVARRLKIPRRQIYARALALRSQ